MPTRKVEHAGQVTTFSRDEFLDNVWNYRAGDHVTILAPTGGGKTQLSYQLLGATAGRELQATVLVMKPRDSTVTRFSKQFGFKIVHDWPPPPQPIKSQRPPGWVLWPRETSDPDADDIRHADIFRRGIRANYQAGDRIVFADETYSLEEELGLTRELRRIWTKGRSVGCGLWAASQRPVSISRLAFQAQHIFLGNDPDVDMQRRYGEIGGGVDPALVRALAGSLRQYQFVYINRDERALCILEAH